MQRRRTSEIKKTVSLALHCPRRLSARELAQAHCARELPIWRQESPLDDAVHVQGSRDERRETEE